MKNFVEDMNAISKISSLEKKIKRLEKKAEKHVLTDEETKNLIKYRQELLSIKILNATIKK